MVDKFRLVVTAIGPVLALVIALGSILFVIHIGRNNSTRNCRAALDVRDVMVLIIKDAQAQVDQIPDQKQKENALKFYRKAITELQNVSCHK